MRLVTFLLGATLAGTIAGPGAAQRPERAPRSLVFAHGSERAIIGVTTSSSGPRDTLGLLITSITPGGPAEQAGLEEGNRISSVNGVDLRLAAADAGEPDMHGLVTRRLSRELAKVEPGKDVELRVWADGRYKTVRVKTVRADELPGRQQRTRTEIVTARSDRAVLGVNVSASATVRDTLGILVVRVSPGGPAERAGLVEGNRIAAINGVDVRVPRVDAEDRYAATARVNRFSRELRKLEPGSEAELRVWADGQYRTLRVRTVRASEIAQQEGWSFIISDGADLMLDHIVPPALRSFPPLPPVPPLPPLLERFQLLEAPEADEVPPVRRARTVPAATRMTTTAAATGGGGLSLLHAVVPGSATVVVGTEDDDDRYERRLGFAGSMPTPATDGEGYVIALPGLRLTEVTPALASYLGPGTEGGLLVLEADRRWRGLRAGDVVLSVNGHPVRSGDRSSLSIDLDRENRLEVVRNGKRRTVKCGER